MEIEISDTAINKIIEVSKEYKIEPTVRIYVEKAGCNGASYAIGFDEPKQYDMLTEIDGVEIVTDTELLTKYTDGVSIDYTVGEKSGFIIKSIKAPVKIIDIDSDNFNAGESGNEFETMNGKGNDHKGVGCCGGGGSCGNGGGGCGCGGNKGH